MKLFQLSILNLLILLLAIAVFVFLPSFFIKVLWNSTYESFLARDLTISIWQASYLWAAIVSLIAMSGVIKIDFQTLDSIDLDSIDNPDLRQKIQELKEQSKTEEDLKKELEQLSPEERRKKIVEHLNRSFGLEHDEIKDEFISRHSKENKAVNKPIEEDLD